MLKFVNRVAALVWADIKSNMNLIALGAFFLPAIAALMFAFSLPAGILQGDGIRPFKIAVVCDAPFQRLLADFSADAAEIIEELVFVEREEALALLERSEVAAVLYIPEGIETALSYARKTELELWTNPDMPMESALAAGFTASIIQSANALQGAVYGFNEAAPPFFENRADFRSAEYVFAARALMEISARGRYVEAGVSGYDYTAQLLFILIFMSAAFASTYTAAGAAAQLEKRVYARIKAACGGGSAAAVFFITKFVLNIIAVILTLAPVLGAAYFLGLLPQGTALALLMSGVLASLYIFPIALVLAWFARNPRQVAVGTLAAAFLLLLGGGGVYPLHLLGGYGEWGRFTPAAHSLDAVMWALGRMDVPVGALVYAAAMVLAAGGILWGKEWNRLRDVQAVICAYPRRWGRALRAFYGSRKRC